MQSLQDLQVPWSLCAERSISKPYILGSQQHPGWVGRQLWYFYVPYGVPISINVASFPNDKKGRRAMSTVVNNGIEIESQV